MVKNIKDNPDQEGGLLLIGTCVQTINLTAAYDLEKDGFEDKDGNFFFPYKINDEVADDFNGFMKVRKVEEHESITRTTFAVRAPLEVDSWFDEFPFRIVKASITIDLGTLADKEKKKNLRPNLHVNLQHKSANVAIQPPEIETKIETEITTERVDEKMDRTYNYDFVTPYPDVCYVTKINKDFCSDGCSKYIISFYLIDSGYNKFIAIVLPMLLIFIMTLFNVSLNTGIRAQEYLANSATIALTSVFLLEPTKTLKVKVVSNYSIYTTMVFISLMLCSVPAFVFKMTSAWFGSVGVVIFGCSFFIPLSSMIKFRHNCRDITNSCPPMHAFIKKGAKPFKPFRDDFNENFSSVAALVNSNERVLKEKGYVVEGIGPLKNKLHIRYTASSDKISLSQILPTDSCVKV